MALPVKAVVALRALFSESAESVLDFGRYNSIDHGHAANGAALIANAPYLRCVLQSNLEGKLFMKQAKEIVELGKSCGAKFPGVKALDSKKTTSSGPKKRQTRPREN